MRPRPRAFERPIFIAAPPRSGTNLLLETLSLAPEVWTIGRESHVLVEGIDGLHPAARGFESNRLCATDATPEVVRRLKVRFLVTIRDRDGNPPAEGMRGLRLLERVPKISLRVPFFAAAFPDALFLYLFRNPIETISSMLDMWRSDRGITYPDLPGWPGPPWSLLLVPGWRDLAGKPLPEVAARQWAIATRTLLDDLQALPRESWCVASYDRLTANPQAEVERLCAFAGLAWDRELQAPLPPSRTVLTRPAPGKWQRNAAELDPVMPLIADVTERARAVSSGSM